MNLNLNLKSSPTVATRSEVQQWGRLLQTHREAFLEALYTDTGKTPSEGFLLEWIPVESALKFLESEVSSFFAPQSASSALPWILGRRDVVSRRIPLGRILVVGTWNFPLSLHLAQILFARAAGNRVTFKGSPFSPALTAAFERYLPDILGRDFFEVYRPEKDADLLARIRAHDFDGVVFTGGTSGAKALAVACADALIPIVAEASGSEVGILLPDLVSSETLLKEALDHLCWATWHHSGQTCISPRYWFVPKAQVNQAWLLTQSILDANTEALLERPRLCNERVEAENQSWISFHSKLVGAELWSLAKRTEFSLVKIPDIRSLPSETPGTFGPSACIVGYSSLAEVVEWIRRSPWSLLTTVLGEAEDSQFEILSQLDTTIVSFGEGVVSAGDAAVPFGGRGLSGHGVCHGVDGLRSLSRVQTFQVVKSWPGAGAMKVLPRLSHLKDLKKIGDLLRSMETQPWGRLRRWIS